MTEAELRHKLVSSWEEIDLNVIRRSMSAWKKRLQMVYEEKGGPIEHKLNKS